MSKQNLLIVLGVFGFAASGFAQVVVDKPEPREQRAPSDLTPTTATWDEKPSTSYLASVMGASPGSFPFAGFSLGLIQRDLDVQAVAGASGYGKDHFFFETDGHYTGRQFGEQQSRFGAGFIYGTNARLGSSGEGRYNMHLGFGPNFNLVNACRFGLGPVAATSAVIKDEEFQGGGGVGVDANQYCDFGPLQIRSDLMVYAPAIPNVDEKDDKTGNPETASVHGSLKAIHLLNNGFIIGAHGQIHGAFLDSSKVDADKKDARAELSGMVIIGGKIGGDDREELRRKERERMKSQEAK